MNWWENASMLERNLALRPEFLNQKERKRQYKNNLRLHKDKKLLLAIMVIRSTPHVSF